MYQQGVFFNGGMNTDDEDRLIPNGDYRYAAYSRNYGVNSPSEGALQSMTGNLLQDNTQLAAGVNIVIGSCEDVEHKALILFVWNQYADHSIWRYTVEDNAYVLILQDSLLNFQKENQIYHAAVVNNLLYWTDNYFGDYINNDFNPPRKINIQKAILYTQSGGTDPNGYSEITFNNLDWIKHPPLFSPIPSYYTDATETVNNLKNKLFQFRYQYIYDDNEESAWSPISEMVLPTSSGYISQTSNINSYLDNEIKLEIETGSSIARLIRVAFRIGNTGEFFLYKEYDKKQLSWGNYSTEIISFKNDISGPAISNSERNYDLIPQIAKTIEYLPSNEFAIGNYIEGYDKIDVNEGDFIFNAYRESIENTAFTYPRPTYYAIASGSSHVLYISFNFNKYIAQSPASFEKKYRYETGDIIVLLIKRKDSTILYEPQVTQKTIYFTVPFIDPIVYNTDLAKIDELCVQLQAFLLTQGITSTVMAPSSWSINIPWSTLRIDDYTWYNKTTNTTEAGPISAFRENHATRTFKSGANHEFAIQYYDRANRDGTVQTIPAGEVYVPFNTDYTDYELNNPFGDNRKPFANKINLTISDQFQPPIWATNYQILYRPSKNIANFQQRSVKQVVFNSDSTAQIVLEDYYKFNVLGASINHTPSKGDFVRFVRQRALFERDRAYAVRFTADMTQESASRLSLPATYPYALYQRVITSSIVETYDPNGYMSGGVFTAPYTGIYTFGVNATVTVEYIPPTPVPVQAGIMIEILNGGFVTGYVYGQTVTVPTGVPFTFPTVDGEVTASLSNSANITFRINVILFISPLSASPSSIRITSTDSNYWIRANESNYDSCHYYPEYVVKDDNIQNTLEVLSYDLAGGPNGEETITVSNFDPNALGDVLLTYNGQASVGQNFPSPPNGGFQIEIYTPKAENENDPWYEVGIEFPIINPHTSSRSHAGDVNQVIGSVPAEVELNCGDVYIRERVMATGYEYQGGLSNFYDANDYIAAWFCEDPHYSDFFISNWNNKGRVGLFSPFAKQQHLKASIYHTNALIDNTQINGLSRVEFFNNVSLKDEHGSINKLMQIGDTLKAFQDKKITSVYIQKVFALNGDGTNNVILSDKTFAGVRPHDDDYGCIHPGSVAKVENNIFFYDFYNAAAVQATQGGLINICDGEHKFSVGIRNFTDNIREYEYDNGETINIISHINRSNGEYILYAGTNINNIPNILNFTGFSINPPNTITFTGDYSSYFSPGTTFIISDAFDSNNNGTYTVASSSYSSGKNQTSITISETFSTLEKPSPGTITIMPVADMSTEGIVYSFNRQRWSSYVYQPVLWATQFGNRAYTVGGFSTLNMGKLYEEDKGGDELTFFGNGKTQEIHFLFNSNPTIVKRFLTFMTQSNMPFNVEVSVPPTNQYSSGMSSNMLIANFRNQESYYVSKYFRDATDPNPFILTDLKRLNGRELRGYVLKHNMTNSVTDNKMILFSTNVNFVPSEPLMQ